MCTGSVVGHLFSLTVGPEVAQTASWFTVPAF